MDKEPNVSAVITDDFNQFLEQTAPFNPEFDIWRRMAAMVMSDMSAECGWRNMNRDMDFSDFSGYHMEYSDVEVSLWNNGVRDGSVTLNQDGSVTVDGFDDIRESEMYSSGFDVCECCGFLCRSDENMKKAVKEMNEGHEVVFGMSYDGVFVYGLDSRDEDLKAQISSIALESGATKVRFTDKSKLMDAFNDFRMNRLQIGPEPVMPQLMRIYYDGKSAFSEGRKDVLDNRNEKQIAADNGIAAQLAVAFMRLRDRLDDAAGVSHDRRPFLYDNALFPSSYFRCDSVFLCGERGTALSGVLTVRNGKIGLYDDIPFDRGIGKPNTVFSSVDEAVSMMARFVLSDKNIDIAKKEYMVYSMSQSKGMSLK